MKRLFLSFLTAVGLVSALFSATDTDTLDLSVSVVGNIFTIELQDASQFPLAGELAMGRYKPGDSDFPVHAVVVAGCKSNTGFQWNLQVQADPLIDHATGFKLPDEALKVKGLPLTDAVNGEKLEMPGTLVKVPQSLIKLPAVVYTSSPQGDLGFNNNEGTYVSLGFGIDIPEAQPEGTYDTMILFTLTE